MQPKLFVLTAFLVNTMLFTGASAQLKQGSLKCLNGFANNIQRSDWQAMIDFLRSGQGIEGVASDPFRLDSKGSPELGSSTPDRVSFSIGTAIIHLSNQSFFTKFNMSFQRASDIIEQLLNTCCRGADTCIGGSAVGVNTDILVEVFGPDV